MNIYAQYTDPELLLSVNNYSPVYDHKERGPEVARKPEKRISEVGRKPVINLRRPYIFKCISHLHPSRRITCRNWILQKIDIDILRINRPTMSEIPKS